jgi:hypothetical protein
MLGACVSVTALGDVAVPSNDEEPWMNPKTTIPMILCGMLMASACKNDHHTMPPTDTPSEAPLDQPVQDPGEAVIDDELAPPGDADEMRTVPGGEAVEEYREEEQESME